MKPFAPDLKIAFSIEAEIGQPRSAGEGPIGERLHIPILGGRVQGPKLNGAILPGGSDWPIIGPDGHSHIDAHYTVEATDGTLIYVHNKGIRVSSRETLSAVLRGEDVGRDEFYMRAAPVFDAPDGPHSWLRRRLFVCSLMPRTERISIDVYVVN